MKLNLACGKRKLDGFKGVDLRPGDGVDIVCDLEQYPWPFEDNSVGEIYISHYAEHTKDLMKFMNELWRVCENEAKVTIVGPYQTSMQAWADPTHTRVLSEATWAYYNKAWREREMLDHYPITCNFEIGKAVVFFRPPWDKKSEEARRFAKEHYWNVISEICVELKAIK